ncbi:PP2C family protein-serine/threonine phosphatase [Methylacidimicrobium tartarophylax]|uniref:PPM family protein phosphatase n=1 Tax=Methylacidimicrobium tartarophylax TaxID=1041768 RepID=A0A5E6MN76_9BACT|nr:PP2C family serine/threonine-protein phosphatase [Methylacidimicrobium tartarophylax]VVM06874.1 PPM family protein phosphatase [Methylacidimicrobium tartarophylax]
MNFDTASLTGRGGRADNEDACDWTAGGGLTAWVVADGLGGEQGGEIASRLAVETFLESFRLDPFLSSEALLSYVAQADRTIQVRQAADENLARMGSTIVAAVCDGQRLRAIHLGDSRFYWFRRGKVFFQTKDHSLPQALCDAGIIAPEEVRSHPNRNVLLGCLGSPDRPTPSVSPEWEIEPGSALLLCTDGFWAPLREEEMEGTLLHAANAADWLARMLELRHQREPALSDNDNYTAIGVFAGGIQSPKD